MFSSGEHWTGRTPPMPDYSCPVSGTTVSCTVAPQPGALLFGRSRCLPSAAVFLFRTHDMCDCLVIHDMCDCLVFWFLKHELKKCFDGAWWLATVKSCSGSNFHVSAWPACRTSVDRGMGALLEACWFGYNCSSCCTCSTDRDWALRHLSILRLRHLSIIDDRVFNCHTYHILGHLQFGLIAQCSFSTSKICIQTNCQMSRPFWFLSFVLVMCVMCESQRNRIPSWKKGRGSVLSGVLCCN